MQEPVVGDDAEGWQGCNGGFWNFSAERVTSDGKYMIAEVAHFTTSNLIMLEKSRCESRQNFELLDFCVYLARIGQIGLRLDRVVASLASTSETFRDQGPSIQDER
jgi:hypothetical protein